MCKKWILLLVVIALLLTGCTAKKQEAPLTCDGLATAMQNACAFSELTDANEKYLEKYLMIEAEELDGWIFRRDASRATPEMILVLQVKQGADQAAIKQAVQDYHDEQIMMYRDYQPEQVFKLENAKILEKGTFLVLAVAPDTAKINAALGDGWK